MTAKQKILQRLSVADHPLACHEMAIDGFSENCVASRLPELAKAGLVVGRVREGKKFKEWSIPRGQQVLWPDDLRVREFPRTEDLL